VKIIDCEQRSTEWFRARCGVVTASEIDALVTPKWKIREGQGVETYLCQKVAEKIMGWSKDELQPLSAWVVDQGKIVETIAIPWYEFEFNTKVRRVGFCVSDDGRIGCSPDGILPNGEGLEIKSPQPDNAIRYLLAGKVPDDYLPQIHFSMYVTGFKAWNFCSYSRHLPALVLRVERDEAIQLVLEQALDAFYAKMDAALARIESLRK